MSFIMVCLKWVLSLNIGRIRFRDFTNDYEGAVKVLGFLTPTYFSHCKLIDFQLIIGYQPPIYAFCYLCIAWQFLALFCSVFVMVK